MHEYMISVDPKGKEAGFLVARFRGKIWDAESRLSLEAEKLPGRTLRLWSFCRELEHV